MGAGMGGLGPYGPFVALDRMAAQTQAMQLANQLTGNQLQGQGVLGAAMMQPGFGQGMPGGSPGYNPATPAPGQASQPLQITPNGVTGIPGGQPMPPDPAQPISIPPMPSSPAGGAQAASAGGMPPSQPVSLTGADATQALAGQGAPSGQPGAPAQPSSETGAPGQQQVLSLDKVLGSIVKANPKASPTQIYNAAALYLPFMQEQDQALLRQALYSTNLERTREIIQGRQGVADTQVAGKLQATQMLNDVKLKIANDKDSQASLNRDARVQHWVAQEQQAGRTANVQMVLGLQRAIAARESVINGTSLLEGQDPTAAVANAKQAQSEIEQLQQELDNITSQGSANTPSTGKAPNITTLKTRVVPGASAPLPAGGFQ